ncbi:peptidase S8/S53 domain-containing protein [Lasiosphaeria miniovina]|uniref:Peptidase S8/S53 domain-containing protein n=1 Tax=Lasiosphaeria miniovina TaxID=1954250 RepID=A0AA40E5B3_9PEZI|nr:peptidase S8/S53 domain-containing protein [Lasiosphaeria miniovina]KAK0728749.1 peptidase S8/S53 domain-containing protein [Lasiosphaeria miniovina]
MAIITINGNSLDPEAPALQAFGLVQETAQDSDYILIQTNGPLTKDVKRVLVEKQAVIQEKVSDDTYLCKYTPEVLSDIRALPFITYANVYQPHFVIDARLKETANPASPPQALLPTPAPTSRLVTVDVQFHAGVTVTAELTSALAAAARLDEEFLAAEDHKARIAVQRRYLADVAALDAVKSIREVHPVKLHNNVARGILNAHRAVHPANGTQYEGEGQIVCVSDTGFDKGSLDAAKVPDSFKDGSRVRVKALYALGRKETRKRNGTMVPATSSDPDGHGTHVCGSVLGDSTSAAMGGRIQGTAPKATLVMQSLLDARGALGGIPPDLKKLFAQPYVDHGARIHTSSWGAAPDPWEQIPYDDSSTEIDEFVATHRDMVILFAAGNDGQDGDRDGRVDAKQVMSEAAAKNCISVGASESLRPEQKRIYSMWGFGSKPLSTDNVANRAEGMAAFSSRGPTVEGRVKPDVVAPGTCILSTRSSMPGVVDTQDWGVSKDAKFMFEGGTSMATPLAAGCVAVLRETLVKNGTPSPSAALIKALLINGAVELPGQYNPSEAGKSPNDSSGWGRIDVANSVVTADGTAGFRDEVAGEALDTFDEFQFAIPVKGPGPATLKVTLVWTDPAGASLQNDLDLIVVAADGATERHGNKGAQSFPAKTTAQRDADEAATPALSHGDEPFDRVNNVEQAVWEAVGAGDVAVIVRAHNVGLDGQTFALAWKVYY